MRIFDSEFYINLQSDFTMPSLKRYKEALKKGVCLLVNDATTLFASKAQRTKDRIAGGLGELLSDERYVYQDFGRKWTLGGKATVIMNITPESFENYKNRLFGLTFSERFFTAHHILTTEEKEDWVAREHRASRMHFESSIGVHDIETQVTIPRKYFDIIGHMAKEFSYLSLRTFIGSQDIIKAMLMSHAALNQRDSVRADDIRFVEMMQDYLVNPFSPYDGWIVKYAAQGFSIRDICKKIDKPNYNQQIQRILKKARLRGILPMKIKALDDRPHSSTEHLDKGE